MPAQRQGQGGQLAGQGRDRRGRRSAERPTPASHGRPGDASGGPGAGGGQAGRRAGAQAGRQRVCVPPWRRSCVSAWLQELVAGAVGPTLPGGLVVRIRRSHRRGPGSIPGQGSLSSSSLHLHFPSPPSHLRSLLPNTSFTVHTTTTQLRPGTAHAQARPRSSTLSSLPTRFSRDYFGFTGSLSPCCPFFSHITTPGHPLCAALLCWHTPTLPLSSPDSLLTLLEPTPRTRPQHKPTFLTRARITNTRPLVEPTQQDSISSSPALRSGTDPLANPPHLPQMDHLRHTQSMHSMQHTVPSAFTNIHK